MTAKSIDELWQLADLWEGRWRDKRFVGPQERYYWKKAWEELTHALGERTMPTEVADLK